MSSTSGYLSVPLMVLLAVSTPADAVDFGDVTVVTMARDGSWGVGNGSSSGQALARAIHGCKAMSRAKIGCGAQSVTIRSGWILAMRCGSENILAAETLLVDAERTARNREIELRSFYVPDMPPCRHVLTIDAHDGVVVAKAPLVASTVTD